MGGVEFFQCSVSLKCGVTDSHEDHGVWVTSGFVCVHVYHVEVDRVISASLIAPDHLWLVVFHFVEPSNIIQNHSANTYEDVKEARSMKVICEQDEECTNVG